MKGWRKDGGTGIVPLSFLRSFRQEVTVFLSKGASDFPVLPPETFPAAFRPALVITDVTDDGRFFPQTVLPPFPVIVFSYETKKSPVTDVCIQ